MMYNWWESTILQHGTWICLEDNGNVLQRKGVVDLRNLISSERREEIRFQPSVSDIYCVWTRGQVDICKDEIEASGLSAGYRSRPRRPESRSWTGLGNERHRSWSCSGVYKSMYVKQLCIVFSCVVSGTGDLNLGCSDAPGRILATATL
jgi:hypothetical protein